jgi:hypothetical protein
MQRAGRYHTFDRAASAYFTLGAIAHERWNVATVAVTGIALRLATEEIVARLPLRRERHFPLNSVGGSFGDIEQPIQALRKRTVDARQGLMIRSLHVNAH